MWTVDNEINFFRKALELNSVEQLMIQLQRQYYAFAPKNINYSDRIVTPQSRNGLVGKATEKWCKEFFSDIAKEFGLYAVNGVVCPELGLSSSTAADLAFCTTDAISQPSENIKLIFEIKMGIINNYQYIENDFKFLGDYTTHKGVPSLLRSDSMLKAIGKSINLRVDSNAGKSIPIIILGNSPITDNYTQKVDFLCKSGVIQKFISVYPNPTSNSHVIKSPHMGFETYSSKFEIAKYIENILESQMSYFSSMMNNTDLGHIISIANRESSDELKGLKFLELINANHRI
ncbi:MAG: hypothetical protein MJY49_03650 [Bacteroidales bacterium]|nr:hypothetical protein [Bacteroidales bacterium]